MRPVSGRNSTNVLPSRDAKLAPPCLCRLAAEFSVGVADHAPAGLGARQFAQRKVDEPLVALDLGTEHGEIIFLDLAALERCLRLGAGARIAREQQAARGVLVEAVHRRRRALEPEHQFLDAIFDAVAAQPRGVDREPGGLVDDDRVAIDEQNAVFKVHGGPMPLRRTMRKS